jgi:lysophospholipase L1-like esterase
MNRKPFAVLAAMTLTLGAGLAAVALPASAAKPDDVGAKPAGAAYVAVGDSFAAGTGIPPYEDYVCLHSTTGAYPTLLSEWGRLKDVSDVTCAGASTEDIDLQLSAADIGPFTRTVTVTLGGNDLGWTHVLEVCLTDSTTCSAAIAAASAKLDDVAMGVQEVIDAVVAEAPRAEIYVTGYPYLFGDFSGNCLVGEAPAIVEDQVVQVPVFVSQTSASLFNGATTALNGAIAAGVAYSANPDATFVDVSAGSLPHGVCGSEAPWINGLSFVPGTDTPMPKSFHPNLEGSQAYADAIEMAIKAD